MRLLAKASVVFALALRATVAVAQSDDALPQNGSESSPVTSVPVPPRGDLLKLKVQPEAELLINVELTGNDPTAKYEIRSTVSDSVLLACQNACNFRIWPGRYRIITLSTSGRVQGEAPLLVDQDSRISVKTAPLIEPILGAILTVAGSAAIVLGGYLFRQSTCDEACSSRSARDNRTGLAFILGGVVAVPVGVILLSNGFEPAVTLVPTDLSLNDKHESSVNTSVHRLNWSVNF